MTQPKPVAEGQFITELDLKTDTEPAEDWHCIEKNLNTGCTNANQPLYIHYKKGHGTAIKNIAIIYAMVSLKAKAYFLFKKKLNATGIATMHLAYSRLADEGLGDKSISALTVQVGQDPEPGPGWLKIDANLHLGAENPKGTPVKPCFIWYKVG
ncbi:hypothetical protein [Streptomyces chrestomyceticus]|uniref:hypothetical protein n=1 Tax=Streptomyces chrestomyceticus TaxID=68185 RepID=UPI0019D00C75|nr:hypothetical protein [Streptomyces chrestomyceticus]